MKEIFFVSLYLFFLSTSVFCQLYKTNSYLDEHPALSRFSGNGIGDIKFIGNTLWLASTKAASKSTDDGNTWINYYDRPEFVYPSIVGFDVLGDTVWAALVYNKNATTGPVATGGGFTFSSDGGLTWTHIIQAVDAKDDSLIIYGQNKIYALPVVVSEQNVTYGLSLLKNTIWIASWSSGVRRSDDFGKTFKRVLLPPDTLDSISPNDVLNFRYNPNDGPIVGRPMGRNYRAFSILALNENEIWAGTAGGVNRSTDGGISWRKFNHTNQDSSISGNWIIAIKEQKYLSTQRIWVASWKADDPNEEYGASFTENGGKSWKSILRGKKIQNFAFKDSIIYIASDQGIFRSEDNCGSFQLFTNIYDPISKFRVMDNSIYSIYVKNDTIWIGTGDGLVYTIDNENQKFGTTWKVFRAYQSVEANKSYAYPNPFSPDNEIVRIHYKTSENATQVSIDVFDFGMNLIKRIISNANRTSNLEQEEIWDGKDNSMNYVKNGVYFYRVKTGNDVSWGKIIVLR